MTGDAPAVPGSARAYGALMALGAPALGLAAVRRRRGGPASLPERFGHGGPSDGTPRLWIHGASVGEATAGRAVFDAARARRPAVPTVATSHTPTGVQAVQAWAGNGTAVRLAPWDTPSVVRRFVRGWSPAAYVFSDSELWPSRLLALHRTGAVILGANARVSDRSADRWTRFAPGLIEALLRRVDLLCPQDDASAERFLRLGLPPDRMGPTEELKAGLTPSDPLSDEDALRSRLPRDRLVLAASTHPGEEDMALEAFAAARRAVPDLRLAVAPRHPARAGEVAASIRRHGFGAVPRLSGAIEELDDPDAVYLVDTLGELRRFYAISALAFVGGSTGTLGGHTPHEPAFEGCAVAHGPDTANAADAYAALGRADAAVTVRTPADLAEAFALVARPGRLAAMADRAREALRPHAQVVPDLVAERALTAIDARRAG